MIDWKVIKKIREDNKDNPKYPEIFWIDEGKILHIKVGDFETNDITVSDALKRFKDNQLVMNELEYLLQSEKTYDERRQNSHVRVNIELIEMEIDEEISRIVAELDLKEGDDIITQLRNCCLVQKYIVEHNTYENEIMDDKQTYSDKDIVTLDLYNAVVKHVGVCTSNSLMFKKILERVGVKAEVVALTSTETGKMHAANLVELDGQYYFFDSTLESTIFNTNKYLTGGKLILCCAALGASEYTEFYTPETILPDDPLGEIMPLPENIAQKRIPGEVVNSLIGPITPTIK